MIHVIASIRILPGHLDNFLAVFRDNVPRVRAEDGCIEYIPAVDLDAGLPVQVNETDVVTVIEKWRDVAALQAHLASPHMLDYRERTKDMVAAVSVKVLREA